MARKLSEEQLERLKEKNRKYWGDREDEALKHYISDEKKYDREIERIYRNMLDSIQKEIDGFYGRYASKEGISINEAKKRVTEADIKAYERKAKRYVKDKDFSKQANEEMRLYNLTMKVNRLELLKANIGLDLIKGHDELEKYMGEILQGRTIEEIQRQAGILGNTITINSKMAHAIPNSSFHNAKFSDRIWANHSLLKADLSKLLQTGLIQGKNPRVLAKELERHLLGTQRGRGIGGAVYNMERLMRTELARVQTEVQKASLERNGFTQFEFLANSKCCDICQEKHKKIFKLDKFAYGDNAPPLHPHCRCAIAPFEDTTEFDAWMDHVGSGGETTWANWQKLTNGTATPKTKPDVPQDNKQEKQIVNIDDNANNAVTKNKTTTKRTLEDVSDISAIGTEMLYEAYEERRLKYNLRVVPADRMKENSFSNIVANYKGVSRETAKAFNNTIAKLSKKYTTGLQSIKVGNPKEFFGVTIFATTHHIEPTVAKNMILNPYKMADYKKMTDRIYELGQKGWCVKTTRENVGEYIATHEFAHTIVDMQSGLKNYVEFDAKETRRVRKKINSLYEEYRGDVTATQAEFKKAEFDFMMNMNTESQGRTLELLDKLKKTKISDYSLENPDEFLAEAFTYKQLVGNDNEYANKLMEIIDEHYKK